MIDIYDWFNSSKSSEYYLYVYIGYHYLEGYSGNNGYLFGKDDITESI